MPARRSPLTLVLDVSQKVEETLKLRCSACFKGLFREQI